MSDKTTKYLYFGKIYLGDTNLGAVYLGSEKIWRVPYYPAKAKRPFMLYAPETRDFTQNGFATIHPISAEHDLTFGQAGEITLQLPIIPGGEWTKMQPNVIILAPTKWHGQYKPQAFRIYRLTKSMSNSGQMLLKVYARHVFYDLKCSVIENLETRTHPSAAVMRLFMSQLGYAGQPTLNALASDAWYQRDAEQGETPYRNYKIHPTGLNKDIHYQNTTIANALIGSDNSIANLWGLDFYADNFYFYLHVPAVLQEYGYALENSFVIRYGHDMTDVSEDIDYTDATTYLRVASNSGQSWSVSLSLETAYAPFVKPKRTIFSYSDTLTSHYCGTIPTIDDRPVSAQNGDVYKALDTGHYWEYRSNGNVWHDIGTTYDENPEFTRLVEYGQRYWEENHEPKVSYTAKYAPIDKDPSGSFIGQLDGREVGDTGTVVNSVLGISTTQKIIRKKVDLLHDITLEIQLGNAPASITKAGLWSDTARTGSPSAVEKQIQAIQSG